MSHRDDTPGGRPPAGQDVLLDLNFVPEWARKPAGQNPYANVDQAYSPARRDRHDRPAGRRGSGPGRRPDGARRGGRSPRPEERSQAPRGEDRRTAPRPRPQPQAVTLPIDVAFIPDRARLGLLVRELHRRPRAFPLMELASLMLQRPDHYLVKLHVRPGAEDGPDGITLHQCKTCRAVFLTEAETVEHALTAHLEDCYEVTEVELEPPSGNYVCVCRCPKTGTLLGPPNYHGFQERLQEVAAEHFPGMPLDRYREMVETVHDPDLVEAWRGQTRTRKEFREKGVEDAAPMSPEEVRAHFLSHHAANRVVRCSRAIFPATAAQQLAEGDLKHTIREAWQKESRFPFTMSLAMRPAFKHMRLHLFKANGRETFVTTVRPSPVDPGHAIEPVREILEYLGAHPGCTRKELVEGLRPGAADDAPEVAELVRQFRWLIDKGHVIEFYNRRLSVPALHGGHGG